MSAKSAFNHARVQQEDLHAGKSSMEPIEPDWDAWRTIADASCADIDRCWTCGACDNSCPVNLAAGRLRPQRNVRMAFYGMLDQLLALPDIWYCTFVQTLSARGSQPCSAQRPAPLSPERMQFGDGVAIARCFFLCNNGNRS